MGLFRSRAKKVREKAATELPAEPVTVTAEPVTVTAEPVTVTAEPVTVTAEAVVAHRETTAEARPNPDQPGWGRSIGQQIGRAKEGRASQE